MNGFRHFLQNVANDSRVADGFVLNCIGSPTISFNNILNCF